MLEQDRLYLSKYAIDPEIDIHFDSYDIPDLQFGRDIDIDPDLDDIEIDGMDEDLWNE